MNRPWWREVVQKALFGGTNTGAGCQTGIWPRYGMILHRLASHVLRRHGLGSSHVFFERTTAQLLGTQPTRSMADARARLKEWPPSGVETFDPSTFRLINTLSCSFRALTVTWRPPPASHKPVLPARHAPTILLGSFTRLQGLNQPSRLSPMRTRIYGSLLHGHRLHAHTSYIGPPSSSPSAPPHACLMRPA